MRLCYMLSVALVTVELTAGAVLAQSDGRLWLTDDGAAIIATGACDTNPAELCGVIVGLPGGKTDPVVADARDQLCGLSVLWGMKPGKKAGEYRAGRVYDPETQREYGARFKDKGDHAVISVGFVSRTWRRVSRVDAACK